MTTKLMADEQTMLVAQAVRGAALRSRAEAALHDAGAANPSPPEAAPRPSGVAMDGRAFMIAQYVAAGRPIPAWLADPKPATQQARAAAPTRKPTLAEQMAWVAKVDSALDEYARATDQVFVEAPDEPVGPQYAEPQSYAESTPWWAAKRKPTGEV